ncbi:ABC transporter ATP-binding protein, partial [Lactobacillus sp. XV13L]|nr:ABC transporter ATP-binding protein [Lactobacillus sp. XV13L]
IVDHLCYTKQEYSIAQVQNFLTNDLVQGEENYLDAFFDLVGGLGYVVSALVLLFTIHWTMLVVISVMVIISLLLPKLIEKPLQRAMMGISDSNKKYLDTIRKWLTGIDELQRYFSGGHLFAVLSKSSQKLEQANVKEVQVNQCLSFVNEVIAQFMLLLLYAVTGYLIVSKQIAFGVISIVRDLKYYLSSGIEAITAARGTMVGATSLNRQIEDLCLPIGRHKESGADLGEVDEIATAGLQMAFPNGESLQLPDIKVEPGKKILLTGESGVGKSTLLKILAGELMPSSGRVLYRGGQGNLARPDLSTIGYLPQDAVLFP